MTDRIKLQSDEFYAVRALVTHWSKQPAIVDDDYPEWREKYETYLHRVLRAAANNGRSI